MARVVTKTDLTHYDVQKQRRKDVVTEARKNWVTVVKAGDVTMEETSRGLRRGVIMGADGTRPTRVIDATIHEIPEHSSSTIHRHSWDAIMFVTKGTGWTEIDGVRVDWRPWDTVYLPRWSWHRHGNDSGVEATYVTWSVQPMYETFGVAFMDDAGHEPVAGLPGPPISSTASLADLTGTDPYANRTQRLLQAGATSADTRLHTAWEDVIQKVSPKGARSTFLVDEAIGYKTSGLTAVMHELGPGKWQSKHRHGGEAWLHCINGHGHTEIDGVAYEWEEGDLVVVDHWQWHQHFNDDQQTSSRIIRVHNFDSLYNLMRVLLDPMELIEEDPELKDAPDLEGFVWPDPMEGRPAF
jgi:gentisate 1,2-dioxygenase